MRLFPPVYSFGREAVADCELGGYAIPARSTVFMSPWVVHRDPRFYQEPEEFRPERWTDDFARRLAKFAYFPFGGGPRLCLGNRFAMMEAVLLLATITQRVRLTLLPGHVVTLVPSLTLRPGGGMPVRIERRSP
jgi:cytochrome P450